MVRESSFMAFLEFQVGNNNYELRDVTDKNVLGGVYYQTSLTETSVVYRKSYWRNLWRCLQGFEH